VKARSSSRLHAVVGSDESAIKDTAQKLADLILPPSAGEFSRDVVDGCADNADQAVTRINQTVEALLTLPFFGEEKLVWLKNSNFLGDNVMGRSPVVIDALENLTKILATPFPENISFLLSATEIDKRRSFYKNLSKVAEVKVIEKLDTSRSGWEELAEAESQRRAGDRGLHFSADALELFALATGGETRQIENELQKLELYLAPARSEITGDDVRLLVPLSRAGVIFELSNALARRDVPKTLQLIDQLLHQGETPIGILLVAFVPTVRNLLVVKDLMERERLPRPQAAHHFVSSLNRIPEQGTAHLPRKKDGSVNGYALGVAACHAHRFQKVELPGMLESCLKANASLVTSSVEPRMILTQLGLKVTAQREE
jgi:DNA polymerase-3 subunit delta